MMLGIILKVTEPRRSEKSNGMYQMVFFRDMVTGKSARLCLSHDSTSFRNWDGAIAEGNVLDDLNVKMNGVVDIHSHPRLVTRIKLRLRQQAA